MSYTYTNQAQVRRAFWQGWEGRHKPKKVNGEYPADVRVEFVDFVDMLAREGHISENLAFNVTL